MPKQTNQPDQAPDQAPDPIAQLQQEIEQLKSGITQRTQSAQSVDEQNQTDQQKIQQLERQIQETEKLARSATNRQARLALKPLAERINKLSQQLGELIEQYSSAASGINAEYFTFSREYPDWYYMPGNRMVPDRLPSPVEIRPWKRNTNPHGITPKYDIQPKTADQVVRELPAVSISGTDDDLFFVLITRED